MGSTPRQVVLFRCYIHVRLVEVGKLIPENDGKLRTNLDSFLLYVFILVPPGEGLDYK